MTWCDYLFLNKDSKLSWRPSQAFSIPSIFQILSKTACGSLVGTCANEIFVLFCAKLGIVGASLQSVVGFLSWRLRGNPLSKLDVLQLEGIDAKASPSLRVHKEWSVSDYIHLGVLVATTTKRIEFECNFFKDSHKSLIISQVV